LSGNFPLQQVLAEASKFSVIDELRLNMLGRCAVRQAQDAKGDFIELGVFRGGSALLLASVIRHYNKSCILHLLDSWDGLPGLEEQDQDTFVEKGKFSLSSEDAVRVRLDEFQLLDVCRTYRGWIEDTLPTLPGPFSLAHIDLDLYRPTYCSLSWLLPRMTRDGEIIIDDYGNESLRRFPGVEKAVSELLVDSSWTIVERAGERDQSVRITRQN